MGALSCFVYMVLGLVGVPVFTGGGGPSYVLTPTFGYIIGFIAGAYVTGVIARGLDGRQQSFTFKRLLFADFAGMAVTYVFGIAYFVLIMTVYMNSEITMELVLVNLFLLFLPADTISCIIGALLGQKLIPQINKMKKQMS